jgi:hypothetical protein
MVDLYFFFKELDDPERPNCKFFVADHWAIFVKEIDYVQHGFLSDPPGMTMYILRETIARTGLNLYRCLRTTSALEAFHAHFSRSRGWMSRKCSPRSMHAMAWWFNYMWNIRATIKAQLMPAINHEHLWLRDMLVDVLQSTPLLTVLPETKHWRRVDTTIEPMVPIGIWAGGYTAPEAPMNADGEIDRDGDVAMRGAGAGVDTCTATVRPGAGGVSVGEGAGAASVGVGAIVIAPPCNHSPPRIAAHSLVPAQEWYRARTNQVAPTNPSIVPATFLRHSAALLRGDSTELLAKTGCLVSSATAQKFAEKTAEKVAAHTLLNAHGFSNLQTSLQRTAKAAGTVLLDNVEVLMPEGKHGTPTPLPAPRFGNISTTA